MIRTIDRLRSWYCSYMGISSIGTLSRSYLSKYGDLRLTATWIDISISLVRNLSQCFSYNDFSFSVKCLIWDLAYILNVTHAYLLGVYD